MSSRYSGGSISADEADLAPDGPFDDASFAVHETANPVRRDPDHLDCRRLTYPILQNQVVKPFVVTDIPGDQGRPLAPGQSRRSSQDIPSAGARLVDLF